MNKIFLIAAFLFSLNSFSQDTTWHKTVDTPSVIVHKDPTDRSASEKANTDQ
jgi:hypothetical protein